jgi:mannose-6-phosphate isomerase-like protein (cupin superfamily)
MTTVNLNQLELMDFYGKEIKSQHSKATFPLFAAHGTKKLATVYFEVEPGEHLGSHTDSAEELLLIMEGEAEVIIGNEKVKATKNTLALVPEMVPHNIINTGSTTVKVLGFFGGANNITSTFEHAWEGMESNQVDTSQLFEQPATA